MKKWPIIFLAIILATAQLSWPGWLTFFRCKPDLLLALTVILVFYLDFKTALVFALFCGLLKDVFLPANVPVNTILFVLWSYLIHKLTTQISTENEYVRLGIVLIIALLNSLVIGLVRLNSGDIISLVIFLRNLIIPTIYTAALFPLIFKLTKKVTA
ncbi:MAG: rod shape-determining protein MreD [Candidatus Omnitrophota bacterium]